MAKIVAVLGATGGQGGSVIAALQGRPEYHLRGITRNVHSKRAVELASQGVEIVEANLDDEESLVNAFKDAAIIFTVTDFWAPFSTDGPEKASEVEYTQGVNAARAAIRTPTLEHYVWSTLPNPSRISDGKFVVPHFAAKNRVDDFIRNHPQLGPKTTFLWVAYFTDNLMYPLAKPNKLESSGNYVWLQPVAGSTEIATVGDQRKNVGKFVAAVIDRPDLTLPAKFVFASSGEVFTKAQILETWGRVTGKPTKYVQVSLDDFDALWPSWGAEMGEMLKFWEWAGGKKSWSGEEGVLTQKELGIDGLVTFEETLRSLDFGL